MTVKKLNESQKQYAINHIKDMTKTVKQLAGQFGVSVRTIERTLTESGYNTPAADKKVTDMYILAMCKKLGITNALELRELHKKATDTQGKLFEEKITKQPINNHDVLEHLTKLPFIELLQVNTVISVLMSKRHKEEQAKKQVVKETPNYGKHFPNQISFVVPNTTNSGKRTC